MAAVLTDRAAISVSGPEARSFLQGLIANDVTKLAAGKPLYAMLLTPQGKILFDFLLLQCDSEILLDCAAASAEALLRRLTMYRLRAHVDLGLRDERTILWSAERFPDAVRDPRLDAMGWRAIAPKGPQPIGTEAYLRHRLSLAAPEGADFGSDKMFALDAGLEELHGVSFDKGCYVGQELTARMKHRGTARKRLLPVVTTDGSELPPAGSNIRTGDTSLGQITSIYGAQGFALIRMDRRAEAGATPTFAAGQPVRLSVPPWLEGTEASYVPNALDGSE